jgi:hypothetical protein
MHTHYDSVALRTTESSKYWHTTIYDTCTKYKSTSIVLNYMIAGKAPVSTLR